MHYQQSYAPGSPSGDFVYVIQGRDAVKIGVTRNLEDRLATLQTGSPHMLTLAYHMPIAGDAYAVEAEAHGMLDRHRLAGEWFAVPADVAVAAVNGAAYRLGAAAGDGADAKPVSWLRRTALIAVLFTPQWIALAAHWTLLFVALAIVAMIILCSWLLRAQVSDGTRFGSVWRWAAALIGGLILSVIGGLVIGTLISPAAACSGCGCAGGPGYRLPTGRCASWAQFRSDCNGTCFPPGTHDERGGLMLRVPPPSMITSIGQSPSPSGSPVTPK